MKFISLLLCLCLSVNVIASTGVQSLERSLDEYHYALTVEWDQKDKNFYAAETDKFFAAVGASGLSKEEILKFIETKVKDKTVLDSLKLRAELLSKNVHSSQELAELLRLNTSGYYARGASWVGDEVFLVGLLVVVGAMLAYAIWWNVKYKCVASESYRDCDWEYDSNGDRDYDCDTETRCLEWVER